MTRIIRVELCDECPHAVGPRSTGAGFPTGLAGDTGHTVMQVVTGEGPA